MHCLKNWLRWSVVSVFCLVMLTAWAHADGGEHGDVLVRVKPGVDIVALSHDYNTTVKDNLPGTTLYSLYVPGGMSEADFALKLATDGRVLYAEPDTTLEAPEAGDGVGGNPFHLPFDRTSTPSKYVNQSAYSQVSALGFGSATPSGQSSGSVSGSGGSGSGSGGSGSGGSGSGSGGSGSGGSGSGSVSNFAAGVNGSGVIIAVLDTGVTYTHPALAGHLLPGYNVLSPGSTPDEVADGSTNDAMGHGTMVAGIIARMAPGAKILPVRVLNADGVGSMLDVAKGIRYALLAGARVINMSFGTSIRSSVLSDSLDDAALAGAVIVASAGNNGIEQDQFPASGHGALSVASIEDNYQKSSYSNYGSFVRVVAPGSNIQSTFWDGGYATWSGTSFATPFVSAEAVLMLSAQPTLRAEDVVSMIRKTASSVDGANPNYQGKLGNGLINIQAALTAKN